MESPITIRRLAPSDADAILAIQFQCPELAQWSKRDYEEMTASNMVGWVALRPADGNEEQRGRRIVGFIAARVAADEMEILHLAVAPDQRQRGTASALLQPALSWAAANHARRGFLEVRASNLAALRFYEHAGFQPAGRRANYYTAPIEDALLLAVQIRQL